MRKLIVVCLTLTLVGMTGVAAYATAPGEVSGEFGVGQPSPPTSVRQAADNCIIDVAVPFHFTGDLEGSFDANFTIISHAPCGATGAENFRAMGTFTGEFADAAGTFSFVFEGTVDSFGAAEGRFVILDGAEGLSDLRGQLELSGQAGVGGSYSGALHYDPNTNE